VESREDGGRIEPGYRDLIAWQKAMDLADQIYDACLDWPDDEKFGLTSQTKRAAVSIPANIAEGKGRGTPGDFARFLDIAYGSLCELETLLYMANRRAFIDRETRDRLLARSTEVARLIHGLLRRLKPSSARGLREDGPAYDHADETDPPIDEP
jgi:four helix bundle protein